MSSLYNCSCTLLVDGQLQLHCCVGDCVMIGEQLCIHSGETRIASKNCRSFDVFRLSSSGVHRFLRLHMTVDVFRLSSSCVHRFLRLHMTVDVVRLSSSCINSYITQMLLTLQR